MIKGLKCISNRNLTFRNINENLHLIVNIEETLNIRNTSGFEERPVPWHNIVCKFIDFMNEHENDFKIFEDYENHPDILFYQKYVTDVNDFLSCVIYLVDGEIFFNNKIHSWDKYSYLIYSIEDILNNIKSDFIENLFDENWIYHYKHIENIYQTTIAINNKYILTNIYNNKKEIMLHKEKMIKIFDKNCELLKSQNIDKKLEMAIVESMIDNNYNYTPYKCDIILPIHKCFGKKQTNISNLLFEIPVKPIHGIHYYGSLKNIQKGHELIEGWFHFYTKNILDELKNVITVSSYDDKVFLYENEFTRSKIVSRNSINKKLYIYIQFSYKSQKGIFFQKKIGYKLYPLIKKYLYYDYVLFDPFYSYNNDNKIFNTFEGYENKTGNISFSEDDIKILQPYIDIIKKIYAYNKIEERSIYTLKYILSFISYSMRYNMKNDMILILHSKNKINYNLLPLFLINCIYGNRYAKEYNISQMDKLDSNEKLLLVFNCENKKLTNIIFDEIDKDKIKYANYIITTQKKKSIHFFTKRDVIIETLSNVNDHEMNMFINVDQKTKELFISFFMSDFFIKNYEVDIMMTPYSCFNKSQKLGDVSSIEDFQKEIIKGTWVMDMKFLENTKIGFGINYENLYSSYLSYIRDRNFYKTKVTQKILIKYIENSHRIKLFSIPMTKNNTHMKANVNSKTPKLFVVVHTELIKK